MLFNTEKRIPRSYEVCLSLWCYHCEYYKNQPELCWNEYKRSKEDE